MGGEKWMLGRCDVMDVDVGECACGMWMWIGEWMCDWGEWMGNGNGIGWLHFFFIFHSFSAFSLTIKSIKWIRYNYFSNLKVGKVQIDATTTIWQRGIARAEQMQTACIACIACNFKHRISLHFPICWLALFNAANALVFFRFLI
jgi:hypothetical protein